MRRLVQRRPPAALAAAGLALMVTACGAASGHPIVSGHDQKLAGLKGAGRHAPALATAAAGTTTRNTEHPTEAGAAGARSVDIRNFTFAPATLTVKAGTTLTWMNSDADAHTVTSRGDGPLHSPALKSGEHFSFTFSKPGSYPYYCQIHPFMTATVTVIP